MSASPNLRNWPKHTLSDANHARDAAPGAVDCILLSRFAERDMAMNDLVGRIRAEFLEMPGLRLTVTQAARLWGLDEGACRRVIEALIGTSFLRWTPSGAITRAGD